MQFARNLSLPLVGPESFRDSEERFRASRNDKIGHYFCIFHTPDQLKMPFALWTRQAVQQLIKQQYTIAMPIRTVGEYLKRWGFTAQKPVKRAYEQNPKAVNKWLEEEYPCIAQQVKEQEGEIHWCDETGVRNDENSARGYAPKGKTPVMRLNANRKSISMISAITNQGKVRFMVYKDAMNADLFIKFMGRLIKDAGKKVFLIVDNLRTQCSLTYALH